ncbi:hypothetical protein UFOVP526_11 [uncultured Caudovirales phage]|uniref:Concanavalin A-like lectin/glucanases superfamily n=1 Tax=uncultured Caudovirales phage TaxID=2100421 RepID=A0A6J5MPJ6_9CAUD|nr:hypothetical protein UFOVP526_11 [uncultured Caudovirales phage]
MPSPTPRVYIAFDDTPYVAQPTWEEITSYVMSADIYRGRDNDWQETPSGTASFVLNNNDRRFDPAYTSGVYYGKLLPRKQILITGTANGTEYEVFRGYIAGFPVQYDNAGTTSTVTLSCYDALGLLAQDNLPPDWADKYITSLSPVHYYRCNDRDKSPTIADYGSALENLLPTTVAGFTNLRSSDQLAFGLQSVSADLANSVYVKYNTTVTPATGDATIAFFGAFSNSSSTEGVLSITSVTSGSSIAVYPNLPNEGNVFVEVYNNASSTGYAYCLDDATTSTPAFYTITYTASTGAIKIYINGVDRTQTTGAYAPSNRTDVRLFPTRAITLSGAQFQSVSMYNKILTLTEIQNIYFLSQAVFYETTAQRNARILASSSFPTDLKGLTSTSTAYALDITDDAPSVTSELQNNNRTEGGLLFVNKAGVLISRSRYEQFSDAYTNQLSFGGSNISIDSAIGVDFDADEMANDVIVGWSNGSVANAVDSTSVATYGRKELSVQTQASSYTEAFSLASMYLGLGQYPRPRLSQHRVNPSGNITHWASILSKDLFQRYTVALAPKVGNSTTYGLILQSIRHRIEPNNWETTFVGSSIFASVFRLDVSSLDGTDVILYG